MSSENLIAVIGDIHGCLFTLKALFGRIASFTQEVYSVGDIIDRGKHVSGTISFCISNNIRPVRGNHEDMLIKAAEDHKSIFGKLHLSRTLEKHFLNGGAYTMQSYIFTDEPSKFHELVEAISSCGHLEYIYSFPVKYEFEKVVITHAGITEDASEYTMLWNRSLPADIGKLQVHGHTPVSEAILSVNNSINIDTGCVYGRHLTSVIINSKTGVITDILREKLKDEDISDSIPPYFSK
ncbi:MAG: metallophosphoesterase [Ignavibacteria bacterium]|nr:metallophosphoesterase [Ignavibacteria bacterium]